MRTFSLLACLSIASLGACVSQPEPPTPATLTDTSDENIVALTSALAIAMGRANIKLGAMKDAPATQVTVLPPPRGKYEMNSPALPTHFDILTNGRECWLIQQETGERFEAPGLKCTAMGDGS